MAGFQIFRELVHHNRQTDVTGICPGCHVKSKFEPPVSVLTDVVDMDVPEHQVFYVYGVRKCPDPKCKTAFFFRADATNPSNVTLLPSAAVEMNVRSVPDDISADAKEAADCYRASAWKATVMMCRRVVQAACIEQGAKKGNLEVQIDDLKAKGLLTAPLAQWAHQIRYFGNYGAHPDEDFGDVTKEDAAQMIEFVRTFLRYLYEMPALIKDAQARSGKPKAQATGQVQP